MHSNYHHPHNLYERLKTLFFLHMSKWNICWKGNSINMMICTLGGVSHQMYCLEEEKYFFWNCCQESPKNSIWYATRWNFDDSMRRSSGLGSVRWVKYAKHGTSGTWKVYQEH